MNGLLSLLLAAGNLLSPADTLVDVRDGDRLVLHGFEGVVRVESWDRPQMNVEVEGEEGIRLRVHRSGAELRVHVVDPKSRNRAEELRVTLPLWMDLDLSGKELEAEIRDLEGKVRVRNLEGDLILRNLSGRVDASTSEGSLDAVNLSGAAHLKTGDDGLTVLRSSAALQLETVDGDVHLESVETDRVSVRTTAGDIYFSGRILSQGEYGFYSHDGEIRVELPPPVDLDVRVISYDGDFTSDFPVRARGFRSGEGTEFRLGSGGALLILETFDGDIELVRRTGGPEI